MDAAIARAPFPQDQLDVTLLYQESRVLIAPVSHRLACKASVTLADFEHEPLVRFPDHNWNAFWRIDPRPGGPGRDDHRGGQRAPLAGRGQPARHPAAGPAHTSTPDTSPGLPRPHAIGYERFRGPDATADDPNYGEPIDATEFNPSVAGAAGEIISTTDDSNRFLRAPLGGRVLRPAQLAEMRTTVPTSDAFRTNWPGARYGLGLMWVPNSCGGSWGHGGDIPGFQTRNGVTDDGSRSVIVSINTDSLERLPGVPAPTRDITSDLIDHALCGVR